MTLVKGNSENESGKTNDLQQKILTDLQKRLAELEAKNAELLSQKNTLNGISADDIAKILAAANSAPKKEIRYEHGIYEEEIPEGEYLPEKEWVQFFAPKAGYVITDDLRKGHVVRLPFGKDKLFFEYLVESKRTNGRDTIITPVCSYISKLKSEIAWIRNHRLYNVVIFETTTSAFNADTDKALRVSRIMDVLSKKEFPDIIAHAVELKLPIEKNPDLMRKVVAIELARIEEERDKNTQAERLSKSLADKLLAPHGSIA